MADNAPLKSTPGMTDAPEVSDAAPILSPRQRGFSLVELMISLTIVGIVAAMAIPRYASATARYRVDSAARRIASDLSLTRSQARLISKPLTVVFNVSASSYQISGMEDLFHRTTTYRVDLTDRPYRATIVSVTFNGASQVTFDQYGSPGSGGTIVVDSGGFRKTITLSQGSERAVVQ